MDKIYAGGGVANAKKTARNFNDFITKKYGHYAHYGYPVKMYCQTEFGNEINYDYALRISCSGWGENETNISYPSVNLPKNLNNETLVQIALKIVDDFYSRYSEIMRQNSYEVYISMGKTRDEAKKRSGFDDFYYILEQERKNG